VAEALRLLAERPQVRPDVSKRPSRALPKLPRRPVDDQGVESGAGA
jgi:hypothetical protein